MTRDTPVCGQLTRDDIRLIRALVDERYELWRKHRQISNRAIARKFGCREETVKLIGERVICADV